MELALTQMASTALGDAAVFERIDEIPFEPERKRLVTLHRVAGETVAFVKGAPEEVLSRANWIEVDGGGVALSAEQREAFGKAATVMADRGLRVLALAYRVLPADYVLADVEQDLVVTALVGFEDPPRPEVPAAVRRCREAGIKIVMATGDHPHTAVAVAREIGLVQSAAPTLLTGDDLGRMSDTQLQLALDAPEIVCARVTADQKLRIVTAFQRKRCIVAVTGDGVNDAPALRAADIGIAMGISGTDVAREASDLVLLDDNFASIVNAVEEGRAVFENIRKFLTYILTSNVPELVPYLAFAFARVPLALTVIQILAAPEPLPVDISTRLMSAVCPGEIPTIDSAILVASSNFISTLPSGSSVVWTLTVRVESKPRTLHQVTVYWSAAALTKILPEPVVGSRSAKNGAMRGGPVTIRPRLRSVLALSSSPNVMLPSELTKAAVWAVP